MQELSVLSTVRSAVRSTVRSTVRSMFSGKASWMLFAAQGWCSKRSLSAITAALGVQHVRLGEQQVPAVLAEARHLHWHFFPQLLLKDVVKNELSSRSAIAF